MVLCVDITIRNACRFRLFKKPRRVRSRQPAASVLPPPRGRIRNRTDRLQKTVSALGSRILKGNRFVGIFTAQPPFLAVWIGSTKTTQTPLRARKFDLVCVGGRSELSCHTPLFPMHDSTIPSFPDRGNRTTAAVAAFTLAAVSCLFPHTASAQAAIEGTVPLPDSTSTVVMIKRYEVVSRGGILSTDPPAAIVWIEGDFPPPESLPTRQIVQKDLMFDPTLLPIQVGTTVAFPNEDEEYHNVFSYSRPKRFDLGRYMPDERPIPTQVFNEAGLVTLRCDIHQHMRAIILIIDSPHFVTSGSSGAFRLEGLPAGDFVLKAWVDSKTTLEMPVTLVSGETLKVEF